MKILIPQEYGEVTVRQFKQVSAIHEKDIPAYEKGIKMIDVLCDLEPGTAAKIRKADVERVLADLQWMFAPEANQHHKVKPMFVIGDNTYGFITNWQKLTTGEFIDLETFGADGFYDNLERVMAVMYRPVTQRMGDFYEIEPYDPSPARDKVMLDAPMDAALGAMVFFSSIATTLIGDLRNSSREESRRHSATSGGGMGRFTRWLTGMFSKSKK